MMGGQNVGHTCEPGTKLAASGPPPPPPPSSSSAAAAADTGDSEDSSVCTSAAAAAETGSTSSCSSELSLSLQLPSSSMFFGHGARSVLPLPLPSSSNSRGSASAALGPLERGSKARALGVAESFELSPPRLKGLGGPASELVRFKLLGIKQVELLPEDQLAQATLGLLDLLLFVRQNTLSCNVQRIVRSLQGLMPIDQLLDSSSSISQLML